jgi:diguanylate cyclase (GGDEF)-like protein
MRMRPLLRRSSVFVGVALLYIIAGKLGLRLAFFHPSATPVWAPSGIALVALLVLGREMAPAVFIGAFVVNLTTAGTVATSLAIALGNTLEVLCGATLVARYAGGRHALQRTPDIVRFAAFAAVGSTTIAATIGVTTLMLGGAAQWSHFGLIWLTWWLGDMGGVLVLAPALLFWAHERTIVWQRMRALEVVGLFAGLVIVCQIVFGVPFDTGTRHYPLEFATLPLLVWAAYRFRQRESATAVLVIAIMAVWGTLRGGGPFASVEPNESLLLLQSFLVGVSLTTLMLAGLVAERRNAEHALHQLAVSDPLTELANYRRLITVLELEINRFRRSGRRFALMLIDLNRLKRINDKHGHVVGSRALQRVAGVLRNACRAIDTAARYGGDEFALVLPETGSIEAPQIGARIAELVAQDRESPRISVTVGYAVYPDDAQSLEALLEAADRRLYEGKRNRTMGFSDLPH